ncbi:hypothetical protein A176_007548 [Myxococcus hansupus]|uniref:Uncharacterized protein n=1 Tax=Pseudomyxococcus hansupus TaxID=1297742 RepID=A0A0H4X4L2_9BACT|nr:hypothetical protein A176_007548 [Myxococcus hansupus]
MLSRLPGAIRRASRLGPGPLAGRSGTFRVGLHCVNLVSTDRDAACPETVRAQSRVFPRYITRHVLRRNTDMEGSPRARGPGCRTRHHTAGRPRHSPGPHEGARLAHRRAAPGPFGPGGHVCL